MFNGWHFIITVSISVISILRHKFLGNLSLSRHILLRYNLISGFLLFTEFAPLLPLESECVILRVLFLHFVSECHIGAECWLIPKNLHTDTRIVSVQFTLTTLAKNGVFRHSIDLHPLVLLIFRAKILLFRCLLLLIYKFLFVTDFILFRTILISPTLLGSENIVIDFLYLYFEFFFVELSIKLLNIFESLLKI